MNIKALLYSLLIAWSFCSPMKAQTVLLPVSQKALNDKRSVHYIDFKKYPTLLRDLPIGIFDSGTGGFTVLERILSQDSFDNETGEEKPDGIPDFQNENFEYLADQANMPYGRYDREGKADYLRELAVKDALFLLKGQFWKDNKSQKPERSILIFIENNSYIFCAKILSNNMHNFHIIFIIKKICIHSFVQVCI